MKPITQKIFSAAIVIVLLFFLFYKYGGLSKETLAVIKGAEWEFLAAGAFFQFFYLCFYAFLYKRCFKVYGIDWSFLDFLKLFLASIFSSLISFVGGAIAGSLFLRKARRDDLSAGSVISGLFLVNLADFAMLFIFLIVGGIFLSAGRDIAGYEIFGFAAFALLILGMAFVLVVGNFKPGILERFLRAVRYLANKIAKIFRSKFYLSGTWPQEKSIEFAGISKQLTKDKGELARIAGISFLAHIINAITLFFCFLAFGYQAEWEAVISGYGVGMLFTVVSITPQGLGVVDGVMPAIFRSFGAPLRIGALSVFAFRLLSFWLPALAGFIAFNRLSGSSSSKNNKK